MKELLSWEQIREEIIKLGRFELAKDGFKSKTKNFILQYRKNILLFDSVNEITSLFPFTCSDQERVYHILMNYKDYLNPVCLNCGSVILFETFQKGYRKYCSRECANSSKLRLENTKKSNLIKYGVEFYFQTEDKKIKSEEASIQKYGTKSHNQAEEVKQKKRDKKKEKYGDENYNNRPKAKKTCLEVYGFENPFQNKDVQIKWSSNYKEKTGYDFPSQNPEVKEKRKIDYKDKTGYEHHMQNPLVKDGMVIRYKEKTGYNYPFENPIVKDKISWKFLQSGKSSYSQISQELFWSIFNSLPEHIQDHTHFATWDKEFAWKDKENNTGYFYDFIITSLKICIEFDGEYWHEGNEKRDIQKQRFLEKLGYKVLRVSDKTYLKNWQQVTDSCVYFIKNWDMNLEQQYDYLNIPYE